MSYEERLAALRAELDTLEVPRENLRVLRQVEVATEMLRLQGRRLELSAAACTEALRLRDAAEERFSAAALTGGTLEGDDLLVDATTALALRDLELAPVEALLHLLDSEVLLLLDPGFVSRYDSGELPRHFPAAYDAFAATFPEDPQVAGYLAARTMLSR